MDYVPVLTPSSFRSRNRKAGVRASYRVVIEKDRQNIQTLYWGGSLEETRRIAEKIACKRAADGLRIFELGGSEVCFEEIPFGGSSEDL
jgi:hypothetical protein